MIIILIIAPYIGSGKGSESCNGWHIVSDAATAAADDKGRSVLLPMGSSRAEDGVELICESIFESVDMSPGIQTIERHASPLIVQVNRHSFGLVTEAKGSWWDCVSNILGAIL